ncbi:hypothetical protein KBI5_25055 [Frankia sp. KB5]|nr:hypothetical protein KBI5_25055 [Frankia sp. KB5]
MSDRRIDINVNITVTVSVAEPDDAESYSFDELGDEAKERAIREITERLLGPWWDQHDNDRLQETIVYTLAQELKTPGWDTYGCGDFPGISGVEFTSWSIGSYDDQVTLNGRLTRENAPALPWTDQISAVQLGERDLGQIYVWESEDHDTGVGGDAIEAIETAVRDAIAAALKAGQEEYEYIGSREAVTELLAASDYEFYEDGSFWG